MKKIKKTTTMTKIAAAGVLLAFQAIPESLSAQKKVTKSDSVTQKSNSDSYSWKFANTNLAKQKLTVVALLNGQPVLKAGGKELYQMNTKTGDLRQIMSEEYDKLSYSEKLGQYDKIYSSRERLIKLDGVKMSYKIKDGSYYAKNQIQLMGVDKDGHEVFQNEKKELFYFDPTTGDMVDYVGHVTLLR